MGEIEAQRPGRRLRTLVFVTAAMAMVAGLSAAAPGALSASSDCDPAGTARPRTSPEVSGLWVMNADGSQERRLTDGKGWGSAAWSPDGQWLASWNQPVNVPSTLEITAADGSDHHSHDLTGIPSYEAADDITWTADGTKVLFDAMRDDANRQLFDRYEVSADGTRRRRLLEGLDTADPAVSPDGTRIASMSLADGQIHVMNTDGSGRRRLTNTPTRNYTPSWSPDGSRIVFSGDPGGTTQLTATRVEVINEDGSGRRVNSAQDERFLANPVWSPDGRWVVFDNYPHEDWGWLTVARADGSDVHDLTGELGSPVVHEAAWSPDSTTIAYTEGTGIAVVRTDGTGRACLTSMGMAHGPVWSPDGTKIAFFRS